MPVETADTEITDHLERIIRRVKLSMNYRGSYSTRDILGALVTRWVQSGEWQRLKALPPGERHLGESVRRFILDRLTQLRRRGRREDLDDELVALPDEPTLTEMVELAELRQWIGDRITELEAGRIDPRVRVPVANLAQLGAVLRLHLAGKTQREIASEIGLSVGAVNKRLADGTTYLCVLQGIEQGIGA